MKRSRTTLSLLFLWAVIGSAQVAAQSGPVHSVSQSDTSAPRIIVPLRIYRGFLLLAEGQIGGVPGGQNLVLDTGVAPSILNAKLARQLALVTTESTMAAAGKTVPTRTTILPELTFGPIRANSLPVQVQDLSRLERDLDVSVAAVVGMDVLSRSSFRLDYRDKQIEFGEVAGEGIPLALDQAPDVAVATVRLGGQKVRLVVDTGSEQVVLFGGNLAERQKFVLLGTSFKGSTIGQQQLRIQEFTAPDLVIGTQHFGTKKAYLLPDSADPSFDGLLSIPALGCRALEYNKAQGQFYLLK